MRSEFLLPQNYIDQKDVKFVLDISRQLPSQEISKARVLQNMISEFHNVPIEKISLEKTFDFLKSELKNNNLENVSTALNCFPTVQKYFYQNGGVIYPEKDQTFNMIFTNFHESV